MDDAMEIGGFSSLLGRDPSTGAPAPWLPGREEVEGFGFTMKRSGREYFAYLASTPEGHSVLGLEDADGWALRVQESTLPGWAGGTFASGLPSLEAAVLAALTSVYSIEHAQDERAAWLRTRAEEARSTAKVLPPES